MTTQIFSLFFCGGLALLSAWIIHRSRVKRLRQEAHYHQTLNEFLELLGGGPEKVNEIMKRAESSDLLLAWHELALAAARGDGLFERKP